MCVAINLAGPVMRYPDLFQCPREMHKVTILSSYSNTGAEDCKLL